MDERVAQLIRQGQAAAQSGNNTMARNYLQAAVDLEPDNATGWLWLAGVLDSPTDAKYALERVLQLEPSNMRARQGLEQLNAMLGTTTPAPTPPLYEDARPVRGTGPLAGGTGPLSIEQELRASLRSDAPPPVTTGADLRASFAPAAPSAADSTATRRVAMPAVNPNQLYMALAITLAVTLVLSFICFGLVLTGIVGG